MRNLIRLFSFKVVLPVVLLTSTNAVLAQSCNPTWDKTANSNCEYNSIQFRANSTGITSYEWDFGDNTNKIFIQDPTHTFYRAGSYLITFKGSGTSGTCTKTFIIKINAKPYVYFNSTKPDSCMIVNITLTNLTDTNLKLKNIAKFVWDFGEPGSTNNIISGDSITNTKFYKSVSHRYNSNGKSNGYYKFNCSLTVTSNNGCSSSSIQQIAETFDKQKLKIKNDNSINCSSSPNVDFSLIDIGAGLPISSNTILWNFGDPKSGPLNTSNGYPNVVSHKFEIGSWMTSVNIKFGACNIIYFDTITKNGPTSLIEIPNVRISENEKYQSTIRDSIHFTNSSVFYHNDLKILFEDSTINGKYVFTWPGNQTIIPSKVKNQRNRDHVLRLWDFGDNYAPKCTTDTKKNKNVGLNCNWSMDSLPVHWYTPWDQIYKSQFYSEPAEKTVLCKGGKYCFKINYYRQNSLIMPADTLVIIAKDSTYTYAGRTITPSTKEKTTGTFRIKKVPSKYKGQAFYTPTLSDETWIFYTNSVITIKNIITGNKYTTGSGTITLKKGDQFELKKGDSAILLSQVWITSAKTVSAQPATACIDTIIGGRDTFIQRSRVFIDSNFHRNNFYLKNSKCYNVTLYQEDTVHSLRCKSSNTISLALVAPSADGLTFEGIKCYAPPSPPYGITFSVAGTKPGLTQRLLKFNFDSASGKNNWVNHNGFLAPPLPGSSPWTLGYAISGAYPNSFVMPYGAGQIQQKNPGWVTVGLIIGNGRLVSGIPENMDTTWYHNAFRYFYLDARFDVIQPERDQKTVCVGDTITFKLVDPKMDSITSLVWSWNDDEGTYYEERNFYYKPYPGPSSTRNDKVIKDWKKGDKWLYNYVIRLEYDGYNFKTLDTIVTGIIRKWSIAVDLSGSAVALENAFKSVGLNVREIPANEIGLYLGNGTGKGCIDTTGFGNLIKFGVAPYRDALTYKNGTTWYRYTDYSKTNSTIVSQKLHLRDSSQAGWDTLKQKTVNKYSGLKITPGVYRHVYKKGGRYFPTFQVRNTAGCFQPRNKEVDVGFFSGTSFKDTAICGSNEIIFNDSIRYFAFEDPFVWLNPTAYWKDSKRFINNRETKKIDFNQYDDTLSSKRFEITGLGPFKYKYDKPGVYTIRMAMKDSLGCRDTLKHTFRLIFMSKIGFTFNTPNQCLRNNKYNFNDTNSTLGAATRLWKFGDNTTSTDQKPTKTYSKSGTYVVKLIITTQNGCRDSVIQNIIVYPIPNIKLRVNDSTQCFKSNSFTFSDSSTISSGSMTSAWDFGDATTGNVKIVNKNYKSAGSFKVRLITTSNSICKDTSTIKVFVYSQPVVTLIAVNDSNFCMGDSALLIAKGASSYLWSNNTKNDSVLVKNAGIYTITGTDNNGCSAQKSITIKVNPIPSKPVITRFHKDSLKSSYKEFNQWLFNGNKINGATNQKHKIMAKGIYSILYTDANGCSVVSDTLGVRSGFGAINLINRNNFILYPNPTNDKINLEFENPYLGKVTLVDAIGNLILEQEINNESKVSLSISHLAYGIYTLRISNSAIKVMKL